MGNCYTEFSKSEIEDYEHLTYLTKREIVRAWNMWKSVTEECHPSKVARFPKRIVLKIPYLTANPFANNIIQTFSSEKDNQWSFEDFLDMASIMSSKAPVEVKTQWAFKIYDMDEDGVLDSSDIGSVIDILVCKKLEDKASMQLISKVLEETDFDGSGISTDEFGHLMSKSIDFTHSFQFSI
ncbi:UNVERIFIED_CONTAM: hypothetical protein RMT77_018433 [Armadillidium vulgare]